MFKGMRHKNLGGAFVLEFAQGACVVDNVRHYSRVNIYPSKPCVFQKAASYIEFVILH